MTCGGAYACAISCTGAPEHSKIGVGGDSAGGRISASIAHDEPVDFQVI